MSFAHSLQAVGTPLFQPTLQRELARYVESAALWEHLREHDFLVDIQLQSLRDVEVLADMLVVRGLIAFQDVQRGGCSLPEHRVFRTQTFELRISRSTGHAELAQAGSGWGQLDGDYY